MSAQPFKFEKSRATKSRVLESWYDFYNERYYESALPKVSVYWYSSRKRRLHASTVLQDGKPIAVRQILTIPVVPGSDVSSYNLTFGVPLSSYKLTQPAGFL